MWKLLFILHIVPATVFVDRGIQQYRDELSRLQREPNRRGRAYHSGVSDDLQEVLNAVIETFNPDTISLVGYSLGGNVLLT